MNPIPALPPIPEADLLTAAEAAAFLKISRRAFFREVAEGRMLQPIRVTPRSPRWDRLQLRIWLDMKGREQATAHASASGSKGGAA